MSQIRMVEIMIGMIPESLLSYLEVIPMRSLLMTSEVVLITIIIFVSHTYQAIEPRWSYHYVSDIVFDCELFMLSQSEKLCVLVR